MKRKLRVFLMILAIIAIQIGSNVYASSLDDIIADSYEDEDENYEESVTEGAEEDANTKTEVDAEDKKPEGSNSNIGNLTKPSGNKLDLSDAAVDTDTSVAVDAVNTGINKLVSFLVQVLAYFATACLTLRVVLDLVYILVPFSRVLLSNGHRGTAQDTQQNNNFGGMNSGFGSMNSGFGSMNSGFGGMNSGFGSMNSGFGSANQNNMNQNNPHLRVQLVSGAALNAVASEERGMMALKIYAKDMVIVLVLAPIFLVLAINGTLIDLGFLLGNALSNLLSSFKL